MEQILLVLLGVMGSALIGGLSVFIPFNTKINNLKLKIDDYDKFLQANDTLSLFSTIKELREKIPQIESDIKNADNHYNTFNSILSDFNSDSGRENLEKAKQLLELIPKYNEENKILSKLNNFEKQLNKIESVQKSQDIIKVGMDYVTSISDGKKDTKNIYFKSSLINSHHHSFINPPEVFVALAKVEAKISNVGKQIRVDVCVLNKFKDKFCVEAKTWGTSEVYEVGFLWIAIGK